MRDWGYSDRCLHCDDCPSASVIHDAQQRWLWLAYPFLNLSFHDLRSLPLRHPPSTVPCSISLDSPLQIRCQCPVLLVQWRKKAAAWQLQLSSKYSWRLIYRASWGQVFIAIPNPSPSNRVYISPNPPSITFLGSVQCQHYCCIKQSKSIIIHIIINS